MAGHRHRPAGDADRRRHRRWSTPPWTRCAGSATVHGLNMTCGASNVSFGMPDRHTLGAAFLPMAMTAGLTSAIMDTRTPQIVDAVKAADLLLGHDEWGSAWIAAHRKKQAAAHLMSTDEPDGPLHRPDVEVDDLRREGLIAPAGRTRGRRRTTGRAGCSCRFTPSGREVRVPTGRQRLRRGELERHRDRLHLRRPRHLQEVQDPGARAGRVPGAPPRRALVHARPARGRLAAGLPGPGHPGPPGRGAAADHPPQGRHPRRRPAGDPAPGRAEAVRRARRAHAVRPAHRPAAALRRDRRPRAHPRPARAAPAARRCCGRPTSRSPRSSSTRR